MALKAEVILEAINTGASDEDLAVLEGTDEKEFDNADNPCPDGMIWDDKLGACVPVSKKQKREGYWDEGDPTNPSDDFFVEGENLTKAKKRFPDRDFSDREVVYPNQTKYNEAKAVYMAKISKHTTDPLELAKFEDQWMKNNSTEAIKSSIEIPDVTVADDKRKTADYINVKEFGDAFGGMGGGKGNAKNIKNFLTPYITKGAGFKITTPHHQTLLIEAANGEMMSWDFADLHGFSTPHTSPNLKKLQKESYDISLAKALKSVTDWVDGQDITFEEKEYSNSGVKLTASNGKQKVGGVDEEETSNSKGWRGYLHQVYDPDAKQKFNVAAIPDGRYDIRLMAFDDSTYRSMHAKGEYDSGVNYDERMRDFVRNGYYPNTYELNETVNRIKWLIEAHVMVPGSSARDSSLFIENLNEDEKELIREKVFDSLNRKYVHITKNDFNKLFVVYDKTIASLQVEVKNAKNLAAINEEKLTSKQIQESDALYLANCTSKQKIKIKLNDSKRYWERKKREQEFTYDADNNKIWKDPLEVDKINLKMKEIDGSIEENAKSINTTNLAISIVNKQLKKQFGVTIPHGSVIKYSHQLASQLFKDGYTAASVLKMDKAASEKKTLSGVEIQKLLVQNPSMSDFELQTLWKNNNLKIKYKTEKEFMDKTIKIDIKNLWSNHQGIFFNDKEGWKRFMSKFPKAKAWYDQIQNAPKTGKGSRYMGSEPSYFISVPIAKLYNEGYTQHKMKSWAEWLAPDVVGEKDAALYSDYEDFRIKSKGQLYAINDMVMQNNDPYAVKRDIQDHWGGEFLSGFAQGFGTSADMALGLDWQGSDTKRSHWESTWGLGKVNKNAKKLIYYNSVIQEINSFTAANQKFDSEGNPLGSSVDIGSETYDLKLIEWTPKQIEAFDISFKERLGSTIGGFVPMAIELTLLTLATEGTMTYVGAMAMMNRMRVAGGAFNKLGVFAIELAVETFKMSAVMDFPVTTGGTFLVGGKLTNWIKLNPKRANAVLQLIKTGAVGATSIDVAEYVDLYVQDMLDNENFNEEYEHYFGDPDENTQRWIMNALAFSATGLATMGGEGKKGVMNEAGGYRALIELNKMQEKLYRVKIVDGKEHRVWGNAKYGYSKEGIKTAKDNWNAIESQKKVLEVMIVRETALTDMDPTSNKEHYREAINNMFGPGSKIHTDLKKYEGYEGYEIRYSKDLNDFKHDGSKAEYHRAEGKEGAYVLLHPKKIRTGTLQHEIMVHASIDAYFGGGKKGSERTKQFAGKLSEHFKGIDFKIPEIVEGAKGDKFAVQRKLVEKIEDWYSGNSSIKSEEYLGYMYELLSKPEIYYDVVATTAFKGGILELKKVLRENLNMYTKIKNPAEFVDRLGGLMQAITGGKYTELNAKEQKRLFEYLEKNKLIEEIDFAKGDQPSIESRASMDFEAKKLTNEKAELLKESVEIGSIAKDKRTPEQLTTIQNNAKRIQEITAVLNSVKHKTKLKPGEKSSNSKEASNIEISARSVDKTNEIRESSANTIKNDPNKPKEVGRGSSFEDLNIEWNTLQKQGEKIVAEKNPGWEGELAKVNKRQKEVENTQSLKYDIMDINDRLFQKILTEAYKLGKNVEINDRVTKRDLGDALKVEFQKLVDTYAFQIPKLDKDGNPIMKDGKPVMVVNPTNFSQYAFTNLRLRTGAAYNAANKGGSAEFKTVPFDPLKHEFTYESNTSFGEGVKTSTPSVNDLITVRNEFTRNEKKVVDQKMINSANKNFNTAEFRQAVIDGTLNYNNFRNPTDFQFLKGNTAQKVQTIGENVTLFRTAITPKGILGTTGKASGIPNSVLKYWYESGTRVEYKKTGSKQGLPEQMKKDLTDAQWLEAIGIKTEITTVNGVQKKTFTIDKSNPEYRNIIGATFNGLNGLANRIVYNQLGREYINANPKDFPNSAFKITKETALHNISSGKDNSAASMEFEATVIEQGLFKTREEYHESVKDLLWMPVDGVAWKEKYGEEAYDIVTSHVHRISTERFDDGLGSKGVKSVIKTREWSEGGISYMSIKEFKESPTAQDTYQGHVNAFTSGMSFQNITLGNSRVWLGMFNGHFRTTGENNKVAGEFIDGLRKNLTTPVSKDNLQFTPEILSRGSKIDFNVFNNMYNPKHAENYLKIRESSATQAEKVEMMKDLFGNKDWKTNAEVQDVFNTMLEQYVWRTPEGEARSQYITKDGKQVLNPEWKSAMDFVGFLSGSNAAVGMQGARIAVVGKYMYIPKGKYSLDKTNPDYQGFYDGFIGAGKNKKDADRLAIDKLRTKVEHLMSSNQMSDITMSHIENNTYSAKGRESLENYLGIWGTRGKFDLIDAGGKEAAISTAGIYRYANNIAEAKNTFNVETGRTLYQEMMGDVLLGPKMKAVEAQIKSERIKMEGLLVLNGINPKGKSMLDLQNEVKVLNSNANKEVVMASKDFDISAEVNAMWEGNTGMRKEITIGSAKAEILGSRRTWYDKWIKDAFISSNADDFMGLTNYRLVNKKGKEGEAQQQFYNDHLHTPYAMGVNALNVARTKTQNEYKVLNKQYPNVKKILAKDVPGEVFSNANAIRVYLWDKAGHEVPGLSKKDLKSLVDAVTKNPELQAYASQLGNVAGKRGYMKPDAFWLTQGIQHDLANMTTGKGRAHFLSEFNANSDIIFSKENLNKLEAIHGKKYREALENSLYRMRTGTNRVFSKSDKLMNNFSDWVNGSVGVTMFLNTRSSVLQTLSTTNYIDWGANNPINAAKAFANQPRFWKDYTMILKSPFMAQRFGGLKTDVNHAELAKMSQKGGVRGLLGGLLTKGFLPSKLGDAHAIAFGGATFYRNYYNKLIKESKDPINKAYYELRKKSVVALEKKAHEEAFAKLLERTQRTQQSSDPSKISQLQASGLGRLVFAFQNTPMQYAREMKKSVLDLSYGRGDAKHNISKILYYGAAQNFLFGALQNALFTAVWDDDDVKFDTKTSRTLNGMFDTILRGSGLPGAALATVKNTLMKFAEEEKRGFNADHAQTLIQAANYAPPIGIKARKLYSSMKGYQLNKSVIPHMGYSINNPAYEIIGNFTAATTNFPLDRIVQKSNNIKEILSGDHQWWQNTSLAAGYRPWDIGIVDKEKEEVKAEVKEEKKIESKKKVKIKQEEKKKKEEKINIEKQKVEKKEGKEVGCAKQTNGGRCGLPIVSGKKYCTVHEEVEQNKTGEKKRCAHKYPNNTSMPKEKRGKQCGTMTSSEGGYCYYHD